MKKKFVVMLSALMLMAVPALGLAAPMAGSNTVNSAAIIDGAVATADIANKAVTAAKIADSTITAAQLSNGAVTGAKIASGAVTDANISGTISGSKLGSHTHNGPDIVDGSITSLKLAIGSVGTTNIVDGAVTSSKLSGLIGVDKLDAYSQVYIVHKGAANNQTTFNSIKTAIERIGVPWSGERKAILVMPGTYQEDLSLLVGSGGPSSATLAFNVDIIGASRSGSIIVPTNENGLLIESGMYVKNLTIQGVVYTSHAQTAGIIGCDIISPTVGISGGWQNIKDFTFEDLYIETPLGHAGLEFWGTGENDTLRINNIRIKNGNIQIFYPTSSKPYNFSNITFTGGDHSTNMFVVLWAHNFVRDTFFNLNNIKNNGDFLSAFYLHVSSFASINVTNSQLNNISTLLNENTPTGGEYWVPGSNTVTISNSVLATVSSTGGSVKVGNSQIGTIQPSNDAIKIINSYNSNFDLYANGMY